MSTRLGPWELWREFRSRPFEILADALIRDDFKTWYTTVFLGIITLAFVLEGVLMVLYDADNIYTVVAYHFTNQPWIAWLFAPFLHGGVKHFGANVAFIYIAAPVEQHANKRQYLGLLALAGFLPVYADGVKLVVFGSEPNVAALGASGFAFGLLGYGLATTVGTEWQLTPRWWLIIVVGICAVFLVVKNIILSVGDPLSLNLIHLGGLLVGLAFGYHGRSQHSSGENEGEA